MIEIYTDGSSRESGKIGGFGISIVRSDQIIELYGKQYENITNNQAELRGLILSLELAITKYKNHSVKIYCDSSYCVNAFNDWLINWKSKNYKDIKNPELMKQLYKYKEIDFPNFIVLKCKGHNGIIGNEFADAIASKNDKKLAELFSNNKEMVANCKIFDF